MLASSTYFAPPKHSIASVTRPMNTHPGRPVNTVLFLFRPVAGDIFSGHGEVVSLGHLPQAFHLGLRSHDRPDWRLFRVLRDHPLAHSLKWNLDGLWCRRPREAGKKMYSDSDTADLPMVFGRLRCCRHGDQVLELSPAVAEPPLQ